MENLLFKYPVSKPCLEGNELAYVTEAITSGWISSKGKYVEKFEEKWAKCIGVKYAVTCNSGTSALMLALKAIEVGSGDEVIVPEFTMVACADAVAWLGAKPVFVDCGNDLNIDSKLIEAKITSKTKAIMPVHIYGRPCNMRAINEIAKKHNLFVVEDACEAHGAKYFNQRVGGIGNIGCFSLFANKIINSGEGGICTTNDSALYDEVLAHRLGLLPIKTEKSMSDKTKINFKLSKKGPCTVYASDLSGNAEIVFPQMPLTILNDGAKLELTATTILGTGLEHAKFIPGHLVSIKYRK